MSTTPTFFHASQFPPDSSNSTITSNHRAVNSRPELTSFLEHAMAYLFPTITQDAPEAPATPRQFDRITPRHPSRYRATFTVARLPIQALYFDEMPNLTQSPPRPRELCMSMALDHHDDCPFPTVPRLRVVSHIATLGVTAPVTTCLLKACPHCISMLPDIDPQHPNDSYAEFRPLTPPAWTPIRVIERPEYHTLPPPPCEREHNPACTHRHCADSDNCTCTTTPQPDSTITPTPACPHKHCLTPTTCTCTAACPQPSDHVITDTVPHRNCIVAHCDNPSAHLAPGGLTPQPETRPDPSTLVPPPPRYSNHRIMLTAWTSQCIILFLQSEHAASYTTSCANLVPHMRAFQAQVRPTVPTYDPSALFFPMPTHPNRAMLLPVYAIHPAEVLNNSSRFTDHGCPLIVCPLTLLHELQTGTRTISATSIVQFSKLYTAAVTVAIS
jgi:hypothetical protein